LTTPENPEKLTIAALSPKEKDSHTIGKSPSSKRKSVLKSQIK
jgi:hypothetical protein